MLAKLLHIGAGGVECGEQCQRLLTHRGLDQNWLAQLGFRSPALISAAV